MTFLRKRSRSQCSVSSCEEDNSIARKEEKNARRFSRTPTNTEVTARDYEVNDSCVLRNFPKHKSTHLRFLAWVQYTRQFPDHSITDDERRTCPLLWCRTKFLDQDTMLKHVWDCEYLSRGLYWCFQCQKPERVGKFECKRCQGGSSKTDRIATVAKKMFSVLGARRGMERSSVPQIGGQEMILSKILETSEICDTWDSGRSTDAEDRTNEGQPTYWDPPCMPELPNNCVLEMENTSVVPEMSGDWGHLTQELPAQVSGSSIRKESAGPYTPESWNLSHFDHGNPRYTRLNLPRLNTNTSFDSQRASHPIESSFQCADNPMSATLVSPLSATGGFDFGALDAMDVSPTDSEASGKSIFTDSGYSSTTLDSSWNGSDLDFDITAHVTRGHPKFKGQDGKFIAPLTPKNFEGFTTPFVFPQISTVTQVNTMTSFRDVTAIHSASRCNSSLKATSLSPHWSDAKGLVKSFADVLDEHLRHSRSALIQMASNSIVKELLSLSSSSIVSIGLGVLASLLEGRGPTAHVPLFAFTHLAYAMAIAVDHDSSKIQTPEWFQDSLSMLENLTSERQRQTYTQIVRVIWQPRTSSSLTDMSSFSEPFFSTMADENRLIRACKHFLDIQESFSYGEKFNGSLAAASQFDFVQASFVNKVKRCRVFDELIQTDSIEAFIEDVVEVEKNMNNGLITELRQLELELTCAGKLASQSDIAYNRFQDHVARLCDLLRSGDKSLKSRTSHHLDTIIRTQQLIPDEDKVEDELIDVGGEFEFNQDFDFPDSGYSTMEIAKTGEIDRMIDMLWREADEILDLPNNIGNSFLHDPQSSATSTHPQQRFISPVSRPNMNSHETLPSRRPSKEHLFAKPSSSKPATSPPTPTSSTPSSQANKYRCHCGYEPTGSEEWKASNFARHKRTQHAPAAKFYKCSHPGCPAKYRRSDNLRAHFRSKGHGDENLIFAEVGTGDLVGPGNEKCELIARSSKRRKRSAEEEEELR